MQKPILGKERRFFSKVRKIIEEFIIEYVKYISRAQILLKYLFLYLFQRTKNRSTNKDTVYCIR